jgi:hypothetical protein
VTGAPALRSTRSEPVTPASVNAPGVDGAPEHVPRRPPAVLRPLEDVVHQQRPAFDQVRREGGVVVLRDLLGVVAVEEQQRQRCAPPRRHLLGGGDQHADDVVQAGVPQRVPQRRQRLQPPGVRVDQRGVVPLPARLVLLRAAVVVQRHQRGAGVAGRRTQVDGRQAAVGAHLEPGARAGLPGGREQRSRLVAGQEALRAARDGGQVGGQGCRGHASSLPHGAGGSAPEG